MHKREIRAIISAMLLGDSCLSLKYNTHRKNQDPRDLTGIGVVLHTAHNESQEDYLKWKMEEIDRIFKEKNLPKRCKDSSYTSKSTGNRIVQFYLAWTKYLRIIYPKVYKLEKDRRIKKVNWLLNQLYDDKHLFIWFADDGCEVKLFGKHKETGKRYFRGNPQYRLHVNGFTFGEANIIQQWFESRYNVKPKVRKWKGGSGNLSPVLTFGVKDSRKIWNHISPFVRNIHSMKVKFRGSVSIYGLNPRLDLDTKRSFQEYKERMKI